MKTEIKLVSTYQKGSSTILHAYVVLGAGAEQFRADKDAQLETGCPVFDGQTAESAQYIGQPRFTSSKGDLTSIERYEKKDGSGFDWGTDNLDEVARNSEFANLPDFVKAEMAKELIAEAKQRANKNAMAIRLQRAKAVEADLKKS
jgi:hypothetical protein